MNKKLLPIFAFAILFFGMNFVLADSNSNTTSSLTCVANTNYSIEVQQDGIPQVGASDGCLSTLVNFSSQYPFYQIMLTNLINAGVITSNQLTDTQILLKTYCPTGVTYTANSSNTAMYFKVVICPNGCIASGAIGLCSTNTATTSNQSQCTSHNSVTCFNDNVVWVNSCNQNEDIKETCLKWGCHNGACVKTLSNSCTETDNGYDISVKGNINITETAEYGGKSSFTNTDYCFDSSFNVADGTTVTDFAKLLLQNGISLQDVEKSSGAYLMEMACTLKETNGDYKIGVSYKCPNGCNNGACVISQTTSSEAAQNNTQIESNPTILNTKTQENFFQKIWNWFKILFG